MRVCIEKSTGKLLEMQSDATAGTLLGNAIAAGFDPSLVEEREVNWADYSLILSAQPPVVSLQSLRERALESIFDVMLAKSRKDPDAPQAVKDYLAVLDKS